jgi:hypothetical protein
VENIKGRNQGGTNAMKIRKDEKISLFGMGTLGVRVGIVSLI